MATALLFPNFHPFWQSRSSWHLHFYLSSDNVWRLRSYGRRMMSLQCSSNAKQFKPNPNDAVVRKINWSPRNSDKAKRASSRLRNRSDRNTSKSNKSKLKQKPRKRWAKTVVEVLIDSIHKKHWQHSLQDLRKAGLLKGIEPNSAIFASILPAYTTIGHLEEGLQDIRKCSRSILLDCNDCRFGQHRFPDKDFKGINQP